MHRLNHGRCQRFGDVADAHPNDVRGRVCVAECLDPPADFRKQVTGGQLEIILNSLGIHCSDPSCSIDGRRSGLFRKVTQCGFSLHAGVRCAADQREALEHLCRYIPRPAIANERLGVNRAGQVVLKLKTPYRDGTTHINMSALEFMQRLAALVPRPRLHLIRFHGALAPHAKLRAAIVPVPAHTTTGCATNCDHAHGASVRMSWARLLKRVFDIDIEHCPQCGGKLKIIAAIDQPAVIERILTHLGLSAQPPPRAPARRFELFHAA